MGAFLAIVLESQSREIRLYAGVGLIVFAQIREMLLLSEVEPVRLNRKAALPSISSEECADSPSPFDNARKSYAAGLLERIRGGSGAVA